MFLPSRLTRSLVHTGASTEGLSVVPRDDEVTTVAVSFGGKNQPVFSCQSIALTYDQTLSYLYVHISGPGTSISVYGYAMCSSTEWMYFDILLDDKPYEMRSKSQTEFTLSEIAVWPNAQTAVNGVHLLELRFPYRCNITDSEYYGLGMRSSLVSLAPDSLIERAGSGEDETATGLMVPVDDPFVHYEGKWVTITADTSKGVFMHWDNSAKGTSEIGASLTFTFFGMCILSFIRRATQENEHAFRIFYHCTQTPGRGG